MDTLFELPPPDNHQDFERLCLDLFKKIWGDDCAVPHGLHGQRQCGVDLYGQEDGKLKGVQCKKRRQYPEKKITTQEIDEEVRNALKFHAKTPLTELIIATTARNGDSEAIQEHCRKITGQHEKEDKFRVTPMGWTQILERLWQYPDLVSRYYSAGYLLPQTQISDEQVTQELRKQLDKIRKGRFIGGENIDALKKLAQEILNGSFRGAALRVRTQGLAWCVRLLSADDFTLAEKLGRILHGFPDMSPLVEVQIAQAILKFKNSEDDSILVSLLKLENPHANSAAFIQKAATLQSDDISEQSAIQWLESQSLDFLDLDADGKQSYIIELIRDKKWDEALAKTKILSASDYEYTPSLYHVSAEMHLLQAIPRELYAFPFSLPPALATFPLVEKPEGINALSQARNLLQKAIHNMRDLDCESALLFMEDLKLWIDLRNPETKEIGLQNLKESLSDPLHQLRRLNFAVQFKVEFDAGEANKAIETAERQIVNWDARSGPRIMEVAVARFAMAWFISEIGTPQEALAYLEEHRRTLAAYFPTNFIGNLKVELLARAGRMQDARQLLDELVEAGLDFAEKQHLEILINSEERSETDQLRSHYEETGDHASLPQLILNLDREKKWTEIIEYGTDILEEFPHLPSVETYVRALYKEQKWETLAETAENYPNLVRQSELLFECHVAALFYLGRFSECERQLSELRQSDSNKDLFLQFYIASGDWDKIPQFIEAEWEARDDRTSQELCQIAQLAQQYGLHSQVMKLAEFLYDREKDGDDIDALFYITILAHGGGWEDRDLVRRCFEKVNALLDTSESELVKKVNFDEDFVQQIQKRNEAFADVRRKYEAAEIPLWSVVNYFGGSYSETHLLQALANKEDPRHPPQPIYAYSAYIDGGTIGKHTSIILDAGSILTFSLLGVLEKVIANFEVTITHGTLFWLFQEKAKLQFHQPSRIENAKDLQALITRGVLSIFNSTEGVTDDALAQQIGFSLANFLMTAKQRSANGESHIVVEQAPIHMASSFLTETFDASPFEENLCSCQSIVDFLRAKGCLTAEEAEHALNQLNFQGNRWETEPIITENTTLYLSPVSVGYLQAFGLLSKLTSAGLKVFIHEETNSEALRLVRYENLAQDAVPYIDNIRLILAQAIRDENIRVAPVPRGNREGLDETLFHHPSVSILQYSGDGVDYVVSDDHWMNQRKFAELKNNQRAGIISSHAILNTLASTLRPYGKWMTELRQFGYVSVPIFEVELQYHLRQAEKQGLRHETAELKAIRRDLLAIQKELADAEGGKENPQSQKVARYLQLIEGRNRCDQHRGLKWILRRLCWLLPDRD